MQRLFDLDALAATAGVPTGRQLTPPVDDCDHGWGARRCDSRQSRRRART